MGQLAIRILFDSGTVIISFYNVIRDNISHV